MKYINWYKYMKNPSEKDIQIDVSFKKEDYITWSDLITKTIFYLSNEDKNKILNAARKYIESNIDNNNKLFEYLSGKLKEEELDNIDKSIAYDASLFPQLPFGELSENSKNARICDYLSLRTGLLYSIEGHSEEEKLNIQRHGYLLGIEKLLDVNGTLIFRANNTEYSKKLSLIDKVLKGDSLNEDDSKEADKYKFHIVKGGAVKVKQYYLETNKIKDIRGASMLLDDINRKRLPKYVEKEFIPESIVYNGGGNFFAIVPEGEGENLAKEIEKVYEKVTVTGQSVAVSMEGSLNSIAKENYQNTVSRIQQKIDERQMVKFDFRVNPDLGDITYLSDDKEYTINKYNEKDKICTHCNSRNASYIFNENEYLCLSCLNKNLQGGKSGKNYFKNEFLKYAYKHNKSIEDKQINELEDIADIKQGNNTIGIIYGDGNNMGSIIQDIKSLLQMRYFSEKTESSIYEAVYGAILKELNVTAFEVIAIGGDDIFMIVPGKKAIDIAKNIGERFDNLFKNQSEEKYQITMSLGVTIAKYNTPVQYLFDLSQQLLKSAKKASKKLGKGTMDVMVLETDAALGSSLKYIRDNLVKIENKKQINHTLKPYTFSDVDRMKRIINILNRSNQKGKCYSFAEASLEMKVSEANLFYMYQRIRSKKEEVNALDSTIDILKEYVYERNLNKEIKDDKLMYLNAQEKYYSPWLDIVELWDYVKEEN